MEIIIHGKPNAGSSKATPSIESTLYKRIVDEYFQSMPQLKISDALIVDARYWKNMWYSVYTYWLGTNVKDTADRPSFFAISIVVPQQYYCLVSEVYKLLKRVCENFVVGNYLSGNGTYLVQTFEDDTLFNNLFTKINDEFVNLQEVFDSSFQPQSAFSNNEYYNVEDCDSKAFVNTLKIKGRIIVTEKAPSKGEQIEKASQYVKQVEEQGKELERKNKQIEELNTEIKGLNTEINNLQTLANQSKKSEKKEIKELKAEISTLKEAKEKILQEYQDSESKNGLLTNTLEQCGDLISKVVSSSQEETESISTSKEKGEKETNLRFLKEYLPVLNTVLIIVVGCLVFWMSKSPFNNDSEQIVALQNEIKEKEKTITKLQASITDNESKIATLTEQITATQSLSNQTLENATQVKTSAHAKDVDCKLKIYQDNKPISVDNIDLSKPIFITYTQQEGYDFYLDNIMNADSVKSCLRNVQPFRIRKATPNKGVVISYRTKEQKNVNPQNRLTLK